LRERYGVSWSVKSLRKVKPDYAEAYCVRGNAYDRKGEKRKAEADLAEAKRLGCPR
jgi:Flp pilus assembly protein TadD